MDEQVYKALSFELEIHLLDHCKPAEHYKSW